MGRLRDTELQLAKAQEALTDTRHELSKSKAAGKEWRKQQRLAALDLDNYRRYIKTAREKEKHFKAEMAQANKRQVAIALELAKKDDSAIELKRRIDELSKVAEETFQQQQAMQHQVSSPAPPASLLLPRSSCPARPLPLSPGICVVQGENAGDGR
jgi:chromosome segregation ATPase